MSDHRPQVYEGDYSYIFVSYAHADGAAMPIIHALVEEGYRVWYDDGIQVGSSFPDYIADHLHDCSCVLMLVSRASLGSGWCRHEVDYALALGKSVLPVYLEEVELPRALQMQISNVQALFWFSYDSDDEFNEKLFSSKMIDPCLRPEAKRRRGVGPRSDAEARRIATSQPTSFQNENAAEPSTNTRVEPAHEAGLSTSGSKPGSVSIIAKRDKLVDYSWAELKELSRMIASADGDVEGLWIACDYHLVDKNGKLQGDEKPLQLKDGTKTSIRIIGFRHDELAAGGKSGISFEFANVPAQHRMNPDWTNAGGWERSEMRGWLKRTSSRGCLTSCAHSWRRRASARTTRAWSRRTT